MSVNQVYIQKTFTIFCAILVLILSTVLLSACKTGKKTAPSTDLQNEQTAQDVPVLEVINIDGDAGVDQVNLIGVEDKSLYIATIDASILGENYVQLNQGDRVQIEGTYAESDPVQIDAQKIILKTNPDKEQCEANENAVWRPEGMLGIPRCVTLYADGGKVCTSSTECEDRCMVTEGDGRYGECSHTNSPFGCGSTIEDFRESGSIICVD